MKRPRTRSAPGAALEDDEDDDWREKMRCILVEQQRQGREIERQRHEIKTLKQDKYHLRQDVRALKSRFGVMERAQRNAGGIAGIRPSGFTVVYGREGPGPAARARREISERTGAARGATRVGGEGGAQKRRRIEEPATSQDESDAEENVESDGDGTADESYVADEAAEEDKMDEDDELITSYQFSARSSRKASANPLVRLLPRAAIPRTSSLVTEGVPGAVATTNLPLIRPLPHAAIPGPSGPVTEGVPGAVVTGGREREAEKTRLARVASGSESGGASVSATAGPKPPRKGSPTRMPPAMGSSTPRVTPVAVVSAPETAAPAREPSHTQVAVQDGSDVPAAVPQFAFSRPADVEIRKESGGKLMDVTQVRPAKVASGVEKGGGIVSATAGQESRRKDSLSRMTQGKRSSIPLATPAVDVSTPKVAAAARERSQTQAKAQDGPRDPPALPQFALDRPDVGIGKESRGDVGIEGGAVDDVSPTSPATDLNFNDWGAWEEGIADSTTPVPADDDVPVEIFDGDVQGGTETDADAGHAEGFPAAEAGQTERLVGVPADIVDEADEADEVDEVDEVEVVEIVENDEVVVVPEVFAEDVTGDSGELSTTAGCEGNVSDGSGDVARVTGGRSHLTGGPSTKSSDSRSEDIVRREGDDGGDRGAEAAEVAARLERALALEAGEPLSALAIATKDIMLSSSHAQMLVARLKRRGGLSWRPKSQRFRKDFNGALESARRALNIEKGKSVEALVMLGEMLSTNASRDTSKFKEAKSYLVRAIGLGSVSAKFLLGKLYVERIDDQLTSRDKKVLLQLGKNLLFEAVESGDGRAANFIGAKYETIEPSENPMMAKIFDIGPSGREAKAVEMYREGARLGCSQAMNNCGTCCSSGYAGMAKSFSAALVWFEKSYNAGALAGADNAGLLLETAESVADRDFDLAHKWYLRGIERGHPASALHLGMMFSEGIGRAVDRCQAANYFEKALKFAAEDDGDCTEIVRAARCELSSIYHLEIICDLARRDSWSKKLDALIGAGKAEVERAHVAALLSSACIGSDVVNLVLNQITKEKAHKTLLERFGEVTCRAILDQVLSIVAPLDAALSKSSGSFDDSCKPSFEKLVGTLGKDQAGKLRNARCIAVKAGQKKSNRQPSE